MGTDTPAGGGESKPDIKVEDKNNNNSGRTNFRRSNNNNTIKKERFLGANPSLQGYVFESKPRGTQLLLLNIHPSKRKRQFTSQMVYTTSKLDVRELSDNCPKMRAARPCAIQIRQPLFNRYDGTTNANSTWD